MAVFRESIYQGICNQPIDVTFASLSKHLEDAGFEILRADGARNEILFRCLVELMDIFLWRCWADEIMVRLTELEKARTQVTVFGIPNLLRYRLRKGEALQTKDELARFIANAFVDI